MPTLRADADRLTQVLLNLLSNAAKFVPRPGGRIELRLRHDADGRDGEVQDNGPGVPPAQRDHVFEKFHQGGDASNRAAGTGLGLPISRQIVEHLRRPHLAAKVTPVKAPASLHATLAGPGEASHCTTEPTP